MSAVATGQGHLPIRLFITNTSIYQRTYELASPPS
jgi:hypothetical protein